MIRPQTVLLLISCFPLCAQQWIGTWGASPSPQTTPSQMLANHLLFDNQTIRETVHLSAGGSSIRVRLSNAYNRESVLIGAARVAQNATSGQALTFSGRTSVIIPPDALRRAGK